MPSDYNIPPFAVKLLPGKVVKSVSETYPHHVSKEFTDGSIISFVAMPFQNGTIDVSYIPSLNEP